MSDRMFLEHGGVPLLVEFSYAPEDGDGWDEPVIPADVEVTSIKAGGVEIFDILAEGVVNGLASSILMRIGSLNARQYARYVASENF